MHPSQYFNDLFDIQLYYDMTSGMYVVIEKNKPLTDFKKSDIKLALNTLISNLHKAHDDLEIEVTKGDRTEVTYLSYKHIDVDRIEVRKGKFEPHRESKWDTNTSFNEYNRYIMPQLLRLPAESDAVLPEMFDMLLDNLMSPIEKKYFLNWLSVFFQTRRKSKVAWIIKGEKGIGKGIIMNILRNIFGEHYVYKETSAKSITHNFNAAWKDNSFIIFDEVNFNAKTEELKKEIHSTLKDRITDTFINIEGKGIDKIKNYPFYANILFFSNADNPVEVEDGDRRYNVVDCQSKLTNLSWWKSGAGGCGDILEGKEMAYDIALFFASYDCDMEMYDDYVENQTRADIIEDNLSNEDIFCKKLLKNDIDWFLSFNSVHSKKQPNSDYLWATYIKQWLFSEDEFYTNNVRMYAYKLHQLFYIIFSVTPDVKILGKKLIKKQFTKDGTKTNGYLIPLTNEEETEDEIVEIEEDYDYEENGPEDNYF